MAQYLSPFPGHKKTVIFKQRERELIHAIKNDLNLTKQQKAAEKLRSAKLYLLKAKLQSIETYKAEDEKPIQQIKKIEKETIEWNSTSVEEIIERYKNKKT